MSSGVWAISTDETPGAPLSRGLYQQERDPDRDEPRYALRADLPWVHARIVRRDGSGRRSGTDYLISADRDGPRVIVTHQQVRTGEWAGAIGLPLSDDGKIIAAAGTAIRYMRPMSGDYAGEREAVPRIGEDGRVTVPVAEVLPDGYLVSGPLPRAAALARWRVQIVPVALANPKLALVLGASFVAPYVGALGPGLCHVIDLHGDPAQGKTTALYVAGGLWGNPLVRGGVVRSWNATKISIGRLLGSLGILPACLDERGLASFDPAEWGRMIYSITDGPRQASDRSASGFHLTNPWEGVLISAGNGRMLDGLGAGKYAGVVRRVIGLPTPFTRDADEAEAVIPALREAFGHPGLAGIERFTVAEAERIIRSVSPLVGMPAGPTARTIAKCLCADVAGAAMLDQVLGTGTALRDAAAGAARDYLAEHGHDPEHDADRMLTLVRDCMASQPARWPTVSEYREHRMPRPVYGSDGAPADPDRAELPQHGVDRNVAGVRADDGSWFAVFGATLDELLTRAGADRAAALAEADRRGWLDVARSLRRKGKLVTEVRHVGKMYRFALPAEDEDGDPAAALVPEPEPPAAAPEPVRPEPEREPAGAQCRACGGVLPLHAFDCAALDPLPPEPWDEDQDQDQDEDGGGQVPAALAGLAASGGMAPALAAVAEPKIPGPPFGAEIRAYLADCAGNPQLDRRYHPTADGAVKLIRHHGKAEADMIRAAFAAAIERGEAVAARLDPEPPATEPEPVQPEPVQPEPVQPEPEPAGRKPARERPRSRRAYVDDGRLGINLPVTGTAPAAREDQDQDHGAEPRRMASDEDERAAWTRAMAKIEPDASAEDMAAGLAIFHEVTGVRWVSYAGQVGQAWFAKLAAQYPSMKPPAPLASERVREVAESGPLTRVNYVAKPRRSIRAGRDHVTAYDLNGQHAAAAGSADLGDGEPEVIGSPRSIEGLTGFPGYVRLARPLRTGHPAFGTVPAGRWVAMPLIRFMVRDLGLSIPAAEVIYWPKHGRRLSVYVSRYRDARDKLMAAEQTGPVRLALAALKSQANAFVGMFHSETYSHGGFYRPDWYDMIVSTAEANALRALAKCKVAPVAKMADTAYWIADADPCEPEGLTISRQLGKWKLDRHGPVSADLITAVRDGMPAGVRDAVIRIEAERRAAL